MLHRTIPALLNLNSVQTRRVPFVFPVCRSAVVDGRRTFREYQVVSVDAIRLVRETDVSRGGVRTVGRRQHVPTRSPPSVNLLAAISVINCIKKRQTNRIRSQAMTSRRMSVILPQHTSQTTGQGFEWKISALSRLTNDV